MAAIGRKPTVLRINGGPIAQHQQEFDFDWQVLAANGYVVVAPNPRGVSLVTSGLVLLGFILMRTLENPQALAQGLRTMLRM